MSSDNPALSLALSDIIHTPSLSPAPQGPNDHVQSLSGDNGWRETGQEERVSALLPDPMENRDSSPEPLTEAEVAGIRERIAEMGLAGVSALQARERELLGMVTRLTESTLIDPSQLVRQAEVIYELNTQREYMIKGMQEERERWQAEREGWDRMAEALIAQRNKPGSGATPDEELERKCSTLEADNRILKDRLQETHHRAAALEQEIMKLKPLLLMLPLSSSSIAHASTNAGSNRAHGKSKSDGKKRKRHTAGSDIPEEPEVSDEVEKTPKQQQQPTPTLKPAFQPTSTTTASSSSTNDLYRRPESLTQYQYPYTYPYTFIPSRSVVMSSATTQQQQPVASTSKSASVNPYMSYTMPTTGPSTRHAPSRPPASHTKSHHRKRAHPGTSLIPLTSDARTEHLLLAGRKLGRERAADVAGLVRHAEKEKERYVKEQEVLKLTRETERLEKERLERLRTGVGGMYYRAQSNGAGGNTNDGAVQQPKTPKRGSVSAGSGGAQQQQKQKQRQPTFVYVSTPGNVHVESSATTGVLGTPAALSGRAQLSSTHGQQQRAQGDNEGQEQSQAPPRTPGKQTRYQQHQQNDSTTLGVQGTPVALMTPNQQPQTPLDSLLSAARSMMNDGEGDDNDRVKTRANAAKEQPKNMDVNANANGNGRRRGAAALEEPESPLPKRRRTTAGSSNVAVGSSSGKGNSSSTAKAASGALASRVPSALEVLADQAQAAAAAVIPKRGGAGAGGRGRRISPVRRKASGGKGKGKEQANEQEVEDREGVESEGEERIDVVNVAESASARPGPGGNAKSEGSAPPAAVGRGRPRKERAVLNSKVKAKTDSTASVTSPVVEESISVATGTSKRKRGPPRDRNVPLTSTSGSGSGLAPSSAVTKEKGKGRLKDKEKEKEKGPPKGERAKPKAKGKGRERSPSDSPSRSIRVIPPLGPRIIAAPPPVDFDMDSAGRARTYSPLDEALADHERARLEKERLEKERDNDLEKARVENGNKNENENENERSHRHVVVDPGGGHGLRSARTNVNPAVSLGPVTRWNTTESEETVELMDVDRPYHERPIDEDDAERILEQDGGADKTASGAVQLVKESLGTDENQDQDDKMDEDVHEAPQDVLTVALGASGASLDMSRPGDDLNQEMNGSATSSPSLQHTAAVFQEEEKSSSQLKDNNGHDNDAEMRDPTPETNLHAEIDVVSQENHVENVLAPAPVPLEKCLLTVPPSSLANGTDTSIPVATEASDVNGVTLTSGADEVDSITSLSESQGLEVERAVSPSREKPLDPETLVSTQTDTRLVSSAPNVHLEVPSTSTFRKQYPADDGMHRDPETNSVIPSETHDSDMDADAEADPDHDPDMDAEAEDDDEDRDAEGEDEDERDLVVETAGWPQTLINPPPLDNSKSIDAQNDFDDDADAEGEMEDDLEDPHAVLFVPSRLANGTGLNFCAPQSLTMPHL